MTLLIVRQLASVFVTDYCIKKSVFCLLVNQGNWMLKMMRARMLKKIVFMSAITVVPLFVGTMSSYSAADQHPFTGNFEKYKLGKKVFKDYCSRCHGENADGRGKAIPLYVSLRAPRPSNFRVKFFSIRPSQYLTDIVRDGGEQHSLSEYMPPFGGELNSQQINDVVYFIQNVSLYSTGVSSHGDAPENAIDKVATEQK